MHLGGPQRNGQKKKAWVLGGLLHERKLQKLSYKGKIYDKSCNKLKLVNYEN